MRLLKNLSLACGLSLLTLAAHASTDLRVLIDVSGSMKANDPNSLRQPAAALIARLLPPGSRAGVWLFGTQSRDLVSYGEVNTQWRTATLSSSQQISSSDQFTDIEAALADGLKPSVDASSDCHVILVTDGLIDLRAGAAAIRESRARIESQWLQTAVSKECKIHTLGLSDQTDRALLNRISQATGGLSAQLSGAAELLPVILDALELALPDNRLPLQGQSFQVDSSVRQQTIISLTPADQPLQLITPSGVVITPENLPKGVEYQASEGFQLYQIADPEPGVWQSLGNASIDRVLADADLTLRLLDWPSTLEVGQPFNAVIQVNDGEQLADIENLSVTAQLNGEPLVLSETEDGYTARLDFAEPGTYVFTVSARSGLFERNLRRSIEVIPPQQAIELETGATLSVEVFKPEVELEPIQPIQAEPTATPVNTNEGLTLAQWLWIIGAGGLALILAIAFWLARAEKKA